jgi:hypothetical protein
MMRLRAAAFRNEPYPTEQTYGLSWPLRTAPVSFDVPRDLPETAIIHVRARYIFSYCQIDGYARAPCIDPDATASEWTTTGFTIRPRELLAKTDTRVP